MPDDQDRADEPRRTAGDRPGDVVAMYMTFPNETVAAEIGEALVERRLVACVNVLPTATSIFWWEGAVTREREVIAVAKTTRDRLDAATAAAVAAHPYELPCIVAYPAVGGLAAYLGWVDEETRPD
jgi:periplasmic divalent cation tolerance protein